MSDAGIDGMTTKKLLEIEACVRGIFVHGRGNVSVDAEISKGLSVAHSEATKSLLKSSKFQILDHLKPKKDPVLDSDNFLKATHGVYTASVAFGGGTCQQFAAVTYALLVENLSNAIVSYWQAPDHMFVTVKTEHHNYIIDPWLGMVFREIPSDNLHSNIHPIGGVLQKEYLENDEVKKVLALYPKATLVASHKSKGTKVPNLGPEPNWQHIDDHLLGGILNEQAEDEAEGYEGLSDEDEATTDKAKAKIKYEVFEEQSKAMLGRVNVAAKHGLETYKGKSGMYNLPPLEFGNVSACTSAQRALLLTFK